MKLNRPLTYFFKAGEKTHIKSLLNEGCVCLNRMKFYAECETNNSSIYDKDEGLWMNQGYVSIPDVCEMARAENIRLSGYLFCVTGFSDNVYQKDAPFKYSYPIIPEGEEPFGDTELLVWNPKVFCRRFLEAVKKEGLSVQYNWVGYDVISDKQYDSGELYLPFHKRVRFKWQSEFRFYVVGDEKKEKLFLNIGPITDIACIIEPNKSYQMVHRFDNRYDFVIE